MQYWTKEEIVILREMYPNNSAEECREWLPRWDKCSIGSKASSLKIHTTQETIKRAHGAAMRRRSGGKALIARALIRAHMSTMTDREIALKAGLSVSYVRRLANTIGIRLESDYVRPVAELVETRKLMEETLSELEQLALFKPWRSNYPREMQEPPL